MACRYLIRRQPLSFFFGLTQSSSISSSSLGTRLVFGEHGAPDSVLRKETFDPEENEGDESNQEVQVKMLMAPINPADINAIQVCICYLELYICRYVLFRIMHMYMLFRIIHMYMFFRVLHTYID